MVLEPLLQSNRQRYIKDYYFLRLCPLCIVLVTESDLDIAIMMI